MLFISNDILNVLIRLLEMNSKLRQYIIKPFKFHTKHFNNLISKTWFFNSNDVSCEHM